MSLTSLVIMLATFAGIALFTSLAWALATRRERRRTERFNRENTLLAEQDRQERLQTKLRQRLIAPGQHADLSDPYEESRYFDGAR